MQSETLNELTHLSKNLYDYANYQRRQYFFKIGKMLGEFDLTLELVRENQVDYRAMSTILVPYKLLFSFIKEF